MIGAQGREGGLAECSHPVRGPVCGEGMHIVTEHESLPYQYVLVMSPKESHVR